MTIVIDRLADPVVDVVGQHVTSRYVETWWLPIVGPSALWLLRHASYHTEHGPYVVEPDVLAGSLGIGGHDSVLPRTFARLVRYGCADGGWADVWRFRTHLPQLPARLLQRLPETLRDAHDEITRVSA